MIAALVDSLLPTLKPRQAAWQNRNTLRAGGDAGQREIHSVQRKMTGQGELIRCEHMDGIMARGGEGRETA